MDESPIFPHMDEDFCWRVVTRDAVGNLVPLSPAYFSLAEAEKAVQVLLQPIAP